jgi:hypothetical protein
MGSGFQEILMAQAVVLDALIIQFVIPFGYLT